ncbi:hypothetical protein EKO27_g4151 [Xylaria grammica]|uniref:Uncharacterized protein n=1 Tax=Xylaria grammica TaxID=363999 RepID=A0A439D977_9PEZI|nr:hypothetical protein EKO27_g4151 [Xylaria grammica]
MSDKLALPEDVATWKSESESLRWKSIHEYELACSGSEISREQFLLLRTLWVERSTDQLYAQDRSIWIDDSSFQDARQFLSSSTIAPIWGQFLKSISIHPETLERQGYYGLHTFSLVRYHQAQSQGLSFEGNDSAKVDMSPIAKRTRNQLQKRAADQSSPTPAPKVSDLVPSVVKLQLDDGTPDQVPTTPDRTSSRASVGTPGDVSSPFKDPRVFKAIQDEQIVNTALIEYLNALAIHCTQLEANWTLHRLPLIARDRAGLKTYEARVDGYLRRREDGQPLAIIEVKPFLRKKKPTAIRMQESAQMASWINQHRPPNLSQLRDTKQNIKYAFVSILYDHVPTGFSNKMWPGVF